MSSQLTELSSHDRIRILHDFFRSGEEQYFNFDLSQAMARGQDFLDYIAPDSLQFKSDHFIMGKKFEMCIRDSVRRKRCFSVTVSQKSAGTE